MLLVLFACFVVALAWVGGSVELTLLYVHAILRIMQKFYEGA
jgi:hypothetical protein